ncbi:hypothetical protein RLOC_00001924 [Lonchura striata]|uniref:DDE-1 domain-containing protein n=1 Tax=Lonchura striata TaxID=40157 RepID=A0A218UDQ5_9PASE|nr:hypothetical protein RLOC_00001924 [Lonchura striata domestica]
MKEDRQHPVELGYAITKPDILAEVERGDEGVAAAAGRYGGQQSPRPHAAPAGPSQGDWQGKEVKSEDRVSPPPRSPPSRHAGPADFLVPLRERGCSYCGLHEPEPNPGAGNGGFIAAPPAFESRRCRPGEPPLDCAECGRGIGQKPDLVRHRLGRGTELGYACGRCGRGLAEPAGLGAAGSPHRPGPCTGRSPGAAEGATAAPRKERKELSLTEKVRPQICRIIKNKERILSEWHRNGDPERKRKREGKDAALEAALLRWVEGARAADLPKPPAEKGDAEQPTAEHWAGAVLPGLLRSYTPAEIFACGETAKLPLRAMPWSYRAGSLAGLTAPLFAEWLQEFNEGMRRRGKSVLLLLAKHEAHPYLQLSNGHYRRRLLRWLPAERGAGQPSLLDVLHMLAQAWGDVQPGLIAGCFRAAGFTPDAGAEAADGDEGMVEGKDAAELAAVPPCPSEREAFYELEDAVHM